jgi:iron complex transport system substrate-binding protein
MAVPQPFSKPFRTALALAAAAVLAACSVGGDAPGGEVTATQTSDAAFPVTVLSGPLDGGTELEIGDRPEAIVSLSPTATEMLWAVGAGEQVVAVDDQSDYPEGVPSTDLSGYTPNVEAILGYEPDLVLAAGDGGDMVAGLAKAGVPTLLLPAAADLDEAYSQIERVGAATGHVADAAALVASMRDHIEKAVAGLPERSEPLTYFHELDPTGYTVAGGTFIGAVYSLFGMESIADAAGSGDAYPQLSAEYVVDADPDVIMLADSECCGVTVDDVAKRAGWAGLGAVRDGRVHVLDEDVASRWGPRVVEFVDEIAKVVAAAPAPVG